MALTPGARLGPYEVIASIGVGGMGEVYRARDTKLNRDVALKVLPDVFARDPDRLARFTREAQTLASLNHPNIAHIHGLEESNGVRALVMELVEGEDLSQRIARGAIPVDEALPIAKQIAEALEAAHEQGIIHRDLKPANVKVRPDGMVKVLDFGLAKALVPDPASAAAGSASMSPTITSPAMTAMGMILGTAAYMSPEQARGKPVDKRADIWSFGAVLFDMLTGRRAFTGDDISMTLASVLTQEPDWGALPADTPPGLRRLLTRCLKKDPTVRLRDIGEARLMINEVISGVVPEENKAREAPPQPQVRQRAAWLPWTLAAGSGAAGLVASLALWAPWRVPAPAPDLVRLEIAAPQKVLFDNALLLSPDGRHVAFTGSPTGEGGPQIWVRSLDTVQARTVARWSVNPVPFWSPDSRFIAFQEGGKLKKVDITGGPPTPVGDAPLGFAGGAWNHDNVIVFGDRAGGLKQVSAAGGVPAPLTTLDEKRREISHGLPSFLPDGKHFVYLRRSVNAEYSGIYVGSLGTAPDQQDTTRLIATDTAAVYTPAPDPRDGTRGLGFMLFLRDGTLMAQPFDAAALALEGEPVPIAEQVGSTGYGFGRFSASENGRLVYSAGGTRTGPTRLLWFDRQGKNLGSIGQSGRYESLSISPEGTRVAVEKSDGMGSDLWLIDAAPGGKSARFTFGAGVETAPVWSPDGAQVIFASGAPVFDFFRKPSNQAGGEVPLYTSNERKLPTDWSRDGKTLLFSTIGGAPPDLWSLTLGSSDKDASDKDGGARAEVFLKTAAVEYRGKLSSDGRWIAYVSNATGSYEVYVRPFPLSSDRTGQWMVSNGGGDLPLWRRDGKELFYRRAGPTSVMSVEVAPGALFKPGQPKELFVLPNPPPFLNNGVYDWDVNADGSRFLLNVRGIENEQQVPITVLLNWTAGLKP